MLVPPGIHERLCLFSNQQLQRVENTGSVDQCAINIKSQRLFHIQGGSIILQLEPARKLFAKEISEKHGIPMEPKVGCLSASQWEACFIEMLKMVPEKFHPVSSVGSIIDSP
ncbi:MAG: rRNA adenine N-6-methyltransferase family protein [Synergistaceae bacterium]|nr:rRNA adenine N-6-methyltransferase family protein [Synergistaceae bacterium]